MKFEYTSRWIRFRLELFPKDQPLDRYRIAKARNAPDTRRKLLRQIRQEFQAPLNTRQS